jgi:hypothetical protein
MMITVTTTSGATTMTTTTATKTLPGARPQGRALPTF